MTYGGSEFIKMIQKINKMTGFFFYLCWAGGKINRPGQLAPGVKIARGARYPGTASPQGGKLSRGGGQNKLLQLV